ncbi:MAG: MopE-related protein [Nannocystaceae bacterium]|nr:hypothetical protein [Myxococcales bacterium]
MFSDPRVRLALLVALLGSGCGDDVVSTATDTDATTDATSESTEAPTTTPGTGSSEATTAGSETMGETTGTTTSETESTSDETTASTTDVSTTATTDETTETTATTDEPTETTDAPTTETTGDEELCGDGVDDDDDGEIDEGCPCALDETQPCYPFPEGDVGACQPGVQSCAGDTWGPCEGAIGPSDELCDGLDNNCDDAVDETCVCQIDEVGPCYPGPEGTADVGICMSGTQTCEVMDGEASWGPCMDFVLPEPADACNDGIDNNCDGLVDVQEESLGSCAMEPVEPPKTCTNDQLNPDLGGLSKTAFSYTGADQGWLVPGGVTSVWVKLWGAGGGSWDAQQGGPGGGGGFAIANLSVTPGEMLTVVVGGRGEDSFSQMTIYGGGGHGGFFAGNGGGRSALRRGVNELATAGGGGGAGGCNVPQPCPAGGAGGGPIGEDGEDPPIGDMTYGTKGFGATHACGGAGGTTTCGCTLQQGMGGGGSQFQGGVTIMSAPGQGGGGGGGGFFGGGSGGGDCGGNTGGGGGGGSSYVEAQAGCVVAGTGATAANSADLDHPPGIGNGGAPGNDGNPGRVVIYY